MANSDNKASDSGNESKKGLHLAAEREVKLDDYPERPYSEARTKEQTEALKEAGLL
jgi:hypothetical protein